MNSWQFSASTNQNQPTKINSAPLIFLEWKFTYSFDCELQLEDPKYVYQQLEINA